MPTSPTANMGDGNRAESPGPTTRSRAKKSGEGMPAGLDPAKRSGGRSPPTRRQSSGQVPKEGKKDRSSSGSGSSSAASLAGAAADEGEGSEEVKSKRSSRMEHKTTWWTYVGYVIMACITIFSLPSDMKPSKPTVGHVWYYGWITAISTGLGAVPLIFARDLGKQMLGMSNAIACGMMLSASHSLVDEGIHLEPDDSGWLTELQRCLIGVVGGLLFIVGTKKVLDRYEDIKVGSLEGMDAKKVLLIVFVMTLHSFSEGVGIGVSFGGGTGAKLGFLISATLAVHNVPEGLAVALVLNPRGISKSNTGLWCIFTSIPQPLMAVPAFLFVEQFLPFLPVGLGFAAGAMFYVACFELFADAVEDTSKATAFTTSALSFVTMLYVHEKLESGL